MRRRYPNHRLVKMHRSYTVEEIARAFGIHKNTVRQWLKTGLPAIDEKRPKLIQGQKLVFFLQVRRKRRKQTCPPGQMYCVRCRVPKSPAAGMAELLPFNEKIGNLRAICPDCHSIMHRCVSMAKLSAFQGGIDISYAQALPHIREISQPAVNSDLR